MSVKKCKHCGSIITTNQYSCPVCGKNTQNYNNIIIFCVILMLIFAIMPIIFPSESSSNKTSSHKIVEGSGWDGSVWQVKSWLKSNLKDPSSVKYIEWSNVNDEENGGFSVRVKYRAKNSFGGYSIENKIFYLNSSGNVTYYVDY